MRKLSQGLPSLNQLFLQRKSYKNHKSNIKTQKSSYAQADKKQKALSQSLPMIKQQKRQILLSSDDGRDIVITIRSTKNKSTSSKLLDHSRLISPFAKRKFSERSQQNNRLRNVIISSQSAIQSRSSALLDYQRHNQYKNRIRKYTQQSEKSKIQYKYQRSLNMLNYSRIQRDHLRKIAGLNSSVDEQLRQRKGINCTEKLLKRQKDINNLIKSTQASLKIRKQPEIICACLNQPDIELQAFITAGTEQSQQKVAESRVRINPQQSFKVKEGKQETRLNPQKLQFSPQAKEVQVDASQLICEKSHKQQKTFAEQVHELQRSHLARQHLFRKQSIHQQIERNKIKFNFMIQKKKKIQCTNIQNVGQRLLRLRTQQGQIQQRIRLAIKERKHTQIEKQRWRTQMSNSKIKGKRQNNRLRQIQLIMIQPIDSNWLRQVPKAQSVPLRQ